MNRLEQSEKADDLISFLAAFDVTYKDAKTILYTAFDRIRTMSENDYLQTGASMLAFRKMTEGATEQ